MPNEVIERMRIADPIIDKRVRLLPCQREMVFWWYERGESIRGLARLFKVNKRTIQFLLFPDRLAKNRDLREDTGGSKVYYKKEKHAVAMRKHRGHKRNILELTKKSGDE